MKAFIIQTDFEFNKVLSQTPSNTSACSCLVIGEVTHACWPLVVLLLCSANLKYMPSFPYLLTVTSVPKWDAQTKNRWRQSCTFAYVSRNNEKAKPCTCVQCLPLWYRVPCVPWWYMCTVMVPCTMCTAMVPVYRVYRDGTVYYVYRYSIYVRCVPWRYVCTMCTVTVLCVGLPCVPWWYLCTMCTVMVPVYHVYHDGTCVPCVPWWYHVYRKGTCVSLCTVMVPEYRDGIFTYPW